MDRDIIDKMYQAPEAEFNGILMDIIRGEYGRAHETYKGCRRDVGIMRKIEIAKNLSKQLDFRMRFLPNEGEKLNEKNLEGSINCLFVIGETSRELESSGSFGSCMRVEDRYYIILRCIERGEFSLANKLYFEGENDMDNYHLQGIYNTLKKAYPLEVAVLREVPFEELKIAARFDQSAVSIANGLLSNKVRLSEKFSLREAIQSTIIALQNPDS